MALDEFVDDLRRADRMFAPPKVSSDRDEPDRKLSDFLRSADVWLTPKVVEAYSPEDFPDWPNEKREQLDQEITAFRAIASSVPSNKPATRSQAENGRKHLKRIIKLVREQLLPEWIRAQEEMLKEAMAAAKDHHWYVEKDQKEVQESLLGRYEAPRLRIKTLDQEVVLNPVARFGSGRQGVVDLVVLPTFETEYLVVFKNGSWQIVPCRGTLRRRAFDRKSLASTIANLAR